MTALRTNVQPKAVFTYELWTKLETDSSTVALQQEIVHVRHVLTRVNSSFRFYFKSNIIIPG